MKRLTASLAVICLIATLAGAAERNAAPGPIPWPAGLPVYDHIVIVVEENKDYEEVIDSPIYPAPYINDVLKREGANFTQAFGEEHFSQGNYFWLFSGDNQGVGFVDQVPTRESDPNYPFTAPNLGSQLIAAGLSFKGYAESLPSIGSTVPITYGPDGKTMIYARKHVPWISFANVPNGTTVATSSNLRFRDFPEDMHNRIFTVFAGAHIKPGNYREGKGITHVTILRTIEAMYGLPKAGKQQPNALGAGITDDFIITDVFEVAR